jgi:hypothetical protein
MADELKKARDCAVISFANAGVAAVVGTVALLLGRLVVALVAGAFGVQLLLAGLGLLHLRPWGWLGGLILYALLAVTALLAVGHRLALLSLAGLPDGTDGLLVLAAFVVLPLLQAALAGIVLWALATCRGAFYPPVLTPAETAATPAPRGGAAGVTTRPRRGPHG